MSSEQTNYMSYLLRLWRENNIDTPTDWRASLESALTGYSYVFPCPADLYAFLQRQTGESHQCGHNEGVKTQGFTPPDIE
jgi:hypothetical protein